MYSIMLAPPVVFLILLAFSFAISFFSKKIAAKGTDAPGKTKSYACGEDMAENHFQPEYSQFFKFAYFFTIMHVVVLIVATAPSGIHPLSLLFLGVTVLSVLMIFRR